MEPVVDLYNGMVNTAAVRSAKIVIECPNGQMMSNDTRLWKEVNFNKIERMFYGPSVKY